MERKKKILALLLTLAMILSLIPFSAFAAEGEGDADPLEGDGYIEIYSARDLYNVRNDLSGNYRLMNNIDLSEVTASGGTYDYNGCGWRAIGNNSSYEATEFTGCFDGQGYTISGLNITNVQNSSITNLGLFAINSGSIKNLIIENANLSWSIDNNVYCGIVAGQNNGLISNVKIRDSKIKCEVKISLAQPMRLIMCMPVL